MAKYVSSSRVASKKIKVWLMTSHYDLKPPLSPRWHSCGARRATAARRAPLIILKINCLIVLPAVFDKVSINMLKILLTTIAQWSYLENSLNENKIETFGWFRRLSIFEVESHIFSIHTDHIRDHPFKTSALFRVKNGVQVFAKQFYPSISTCNVKFDQ